MADTKPYGMAIAVLERGFIYVGEVTRIGDEVHIKNAQNVRRWGTTAGLGQLATQGPQPNTKLDPAGSVIAPASALIHLIECKESAWAK